MFWLPRLCEHCLNPACVASCPSGALYKREEDGIVLVDQERCRGWRYCVSGCPYKKVYFNWKTGRAEKCIFCYPRIEAGQTTLCAHSCVGRIRYVGVLLYDADRIGKAAAATSDQAVYPAHLDILLDPHDPDVRSAAIAQGITPNMMAAAGRSPVYALIKEWELALPLHPEFRTLPMVWYVPPLSPVSSQVAPSQESDMIDRLRIPITYLANLLTAGDEAPVRKALHRLSAVRRYMRSKRVEKRIDPTALDGVGLEEEKIEKIYRLLALGRLEDRFVLPTAPGREDAAYGRQGRCGLEEAM
jgi:nitrate reductase / nitrite oxidoreductase, beta subunit